MTTTIKNLKAELIRAETALKSFRDAGYNLGDAVAETIDNSIQAGATKIRMDWRTREVQEGRSKKNRSEVESFAVADNGSGIPASILHNVLTVGFSTRYGSRDGIGRFGVGFKLASISQARRLEVYSRPAYLSGTENRAEDGSSTWTYGEENSEGKVFMTYLDLDEIERGEQKFYGVKEVEDFPDDNRQLLEGFENGTLIVWRKTDRLNAVSKSYKERIDEKLKNLSPFLSRAYRVYIDRGLEIYVNGAERSLFPYDPTFTIENPLAIELGQGDDMRGELVQDGKIVVDGWIVDWRVTLTPKVTRLVEGGGGVKGPKGDTQFDKLQIPDNAGKVSFLRHGREISYAIVPKLLQSDKSGEGKVDRYIGIEVSFPPSLDEYFQVKHIKRGAEPIDKLREELRKALVHPVETARRRIRDVWKDTKKNSLNQNPADVSGGRSDAENVAQGAEPGMPTGKGGQTVTPDQETQVLRDAAVEVGITDEQKQDEFIAAAKQKPIVAVDTQWPGKGLLDIEHLTHTVVVRINRKHPFIQQVYLPLKDASDRQGEGLDSDAVARLLKEAVDGMDLLLFAYAKAENQSKTPEEDYGEIREDWGKFAAVYLKRRTEVSIA